MGRMGQIPAVANPNQAILIELSAMRAAIERGNALAAAGLKKGWNKDELVKRWGLPWATIKRILEAHGRFTPRVGVTPIIGTETVLEMDQVFAARRSDAPTTRRNWPRKKS